MTISQHLENKEFIYRIRVGGCPAVHIQETKPGEVKLLVRLARGQMQVPRLPAVARDDIGVDSERT
jgi:hypothetical protein